jgi:hypothetical protein
MHPATPPNNPPAPGTSSPQVSAFQQQPDEALAVLCFGGAHVFAAAAEAGRLNALTEVARRHSEGAGVLFRDADACAAVVRGEWDALELDRLLLGQGDSRHLFGTVALLVERFGRADAEAKLGGAVGRRFVLAKLAALRDDELCHAVTRYDLAQGLRPEATAAMFGEDFTTTEVVMKTKVKLIRTYMGKAHRSNREAIALRLVFEQGRLVGWDDHRDDVRMQGRTGQVLRRSDRLRPVTIYGALVFGFHALEAAWGEEAALARVDEWAARMKELVAQQRASSVPTDAEQRSLPSLDDEMRRGAPALPALLGQAEANAAHQKLWKRPWSPGYSPPTPVRTDTGLLDGCGEGCAALLILVILAALGLGVLVGLLLAWRRLTTGRWGA